MNEQVNYAKIQRIQDDLDALVIGQFGTGFVTDAMLYESGIKATVTQHSSDLADIVNLGGGADGYSTDITRDSNGNILQIKIMDGETVKATTSITRDNDGSVTSVSEVLNGKTVTTTLNRSSDGTIFSISKVVV